MEVAVGDRRLVDIGRITDQQRTDPQMRFPQALQQHLAKRAIVVNNKYMHVETTPPEYH